MKREEKIYDIAVDYYLRKKRQQEIARKWGVSRVQISNYLRIAEELGIVRFDVRPLDKECSVDILAERLRTQLGLRDTLVAFTGTDPQAILEGIVDAAIDYLDSNFTEEGLRVGIGWGRTMHQLAVRNVNRPVKDKHWMVYPVSGGESTLNDNCFNINLLGGSFASLFGSAHRPVYLPFFLSKEEKKRYSKDPRCQKLQTLWGQTDLLISSLGHTLVRSPVFRRSGKESEQWIKEIEVSGVVGDMLTHFFDVKGEITRLSFEDNLLNISLDQIYQARTRLIVAGGMQKIPSIIGATRAGLVDILITDHRTAEGLLSFLDHMPLQAPVERASSKQMRKNG